MFKFLKELIDSAKEGLAEGKAEAEAELAAEEAEKRQREKSEREETLARIEALPYDEKFGVALGAHFRISIFADWFTVFKEEVDEDLYPLHLYTFGSYPQLEKHRKDLLQAVKRDFEIIDQNSCLAVLALLFSFAGIPKKDTLLADVDTGSIAEEIVNAAGDMWGVVRQDVSALPSSAPGDVAYVVTEPNVHALLASVLSYVLTASTDAGYIEKTDAMPILKRVGDYAKAHYTGWSEYNESFFLAEAFVGLNRKIGKTLLAKYAGYLSKKKGSPWNNIEWPSR